MHLALFYCTGRQSAQGSYSVHERRYRGWVLRKRWSGKKPGSVCAVFDRSLRSSVCTQRTAPSFWVSISPFWLFFVVYFRCRGGGGGGGGDSGVVRVCCRYTYSFFYSAVTLTFFYSSTVFPFHAPIRISYVVWLLSQIGISFNSIRGAANFARPRLNLQIDLDQYFVPP